MIHVVADGCAAGAGNAALILKPRPRAAGCLLAAKKRWCEPNLARYRGHAVQ